MQKLLLALLMIAVCSGGLTGCASSESTGASGGRQVSSIPWNRPAKWEGGGVLGSQMSSMQGY
jgi:hypothetical protein